ncbi:hypothetical protein [Xanthobacter dioxanivorans]|nr:hypothetical protein [Xanthobacter dioxanivorans]
MLTADRPASGLSQGCSAHSCLVEVRLPEGPVAAPRAFDLPAFAARA